MDKEIKKEIERLVAEYSRHYDGSDLLLRAELNYLVLLAEKKQLIEDKDYILKS